MTKPLCIWHDNCLDGFTSAWAVNKYFKGEVDFFPCNYGRSPPKDIDERNILIVDFSFKRPVLEEMATKTKSIVVLDHHATAKEDLAGLQLPEGWNESHAIFPDKGIVAIFDMERSGAGITWDYLFPDKGRPMIVNYIEDRDLWRFKLIRTKEIIASLSSYDMTFNVWEDFANMIDNKDGVQSVAAEGFALLRKQEKDILRVIGSTRRMMKIGGYTVPVINLPLHISEAVNILCENQPFAAAYYDGADKRYFSLRSRKQGQNVSKIAQIYGGGGHVNAAGFSVPIGWEGDA